MIDQRGRMAIAKSLAVSAVPSRPREYTTVHPLSWRARPTLEGVKVRPAAAASEILANSWKKAVATETVLMVDSEIREDAFTPMFASDVRSLLVAHVKHRFDQLRKVFVGLYNH